MRCSSRSTTSRDSVIVSALAVCALIAPSATSSAQAAGSPDPRVERAIVESVRARMGATADVTVDQLLVSPPGVPDGVLTARPEPGARLARTLRFTLVAVQPGRANAAVSRVGSATARVFVAVSHARAARSLEAGRPLEPDDLTTIFGEVGAMPLTRLPESADLIGSAVLRPVAEGEVLTRSVVAERPLVRAGDHVAVRAMAGSIEVTGEAIAAQTGRRGQIIRVVNPESRRGLQARIVGSRKVEVVQ